jgi:LDH2 family malate/lactate/ureidoglycolate dehydrogenase
VERYDPAQVHKVVAGIAAAVGVPAAARVLAESLLDADLRGTSTHGVSRTAIYVSRMQKGLIEPRAELRIERESPSVLVIDAANGLGQVQAFRTLELLMPRARQTGCAAATVRNSQHFGALSYYCNRAAAQGMILMAMTNCEPSMSPEGALEAYFGTNPIAVSFPTGKGYPVRVDLSTSVVARGNVIAAQRKGSPIPLGWALDSDGNPTTDPDRALMGTVLAMAGHKGYALALMVEVFSGILSGAAFGAGVGSMYRNMDRPQDVGHFFCLMDIAAFMEPAEFTARLDSAIDEIKACRRRPGVQEILIPGERSHRVRLENIREGVPLDGDTVRELQGLCRDVDIPFDIALAA